MERDAIMREPSRKPRAASCELPVVRRGPMCVLKIVSQHQNMGIFPSIASETPNADSTLLDRPLLPRFYPGRPHDDVLVHKVANVAERSIVRIPLESLSDVCT